MRCGGFFRKLSFPAAASQGIPELACRLAWKALFVLSLGISLLASPAMAADYSGVLDQILKTGKASANTRYLEFLDGGLHQYAVATNLGPDMPAEITFVEEYWNKSGSNDVIEQWIIQVEPVMEVCHRVMVEDHSVVLEIRPLSTEGFREVADRVARKALKSPPRRERE